MKKYKEIKNLNFHQQINGEKIQEVAIILLLSFDNKVIYDIVANKTNEQLNDRMQEIDNCNIVGIAYIAVTNKMSFIEYKRQIINNK